MAVKRTEATRAARFRIVAAEAHSWSSLLLEDEHGQRFLFVVGTKALTNVPADSANELLATRAYRPWRGERSWAPLDQLPITGQTFGTRSESDFADAFPSVGQSDDAQPV